MAEAAFALRKEDLFDETATAKRARKDVNVFAEYAMRDSEGKAWEQTEFHREWQALIPERGPARVVIVAPREHAKSTQISVARTIWELGRNHDLRIKLLAASDALATDLLLEVALNIERNPRVKLVFPKLKPDFRQGWQKTQIYVQRPSIAKDPSVEACGVLSTGAGGRADLIIGDDVVDFRNAIAMPTEREKVKHAWREVWTNLLGPTGRACLVGTVWHVDDLICDIAGLGNHRQNPEWTVWRQPALAPITGDVLWPEKWSRDSLEARAREIGPRAFARQFLLLPLSDDEVTFPKDAIEKALQVGHGIEPGGFIPPKQWPRYIGVDLGAALGRKNSYTVIFVIAVDPETGRRFPLEIVRARIKLSAIMTTIEVLWRKHNPAGIRVENVAFQDMLLEHMKEIAPAMPLEGHTTGKQKADPTLGLPGLSAKLSQGGWAIPSANGQHDATCDCEWCAWEQELRLHPGGEFDDTVMAMWFADAAAGAGRRLEEVAEVWRPWTDAELGASR